jgi:hypothetical protein
MSFAFWVKLQPFLLLWPNSAQAALNIVTVDWIPLIPSLAEASLQTLTQIERTGIRSQMYSAHWRKRANKLI